MKPVRVSVLMYVFNNGTYLHEATKSILQQTYSDFELIIIDDCSEESYENSIRYFDDQRIKFIRNDSHEGKISSLNNAITLANGELIARIEPMDIAHPWRLEKQISFMDKNADCGILGSWIRTVDVNGNFLSTVISYGKFLYYLMNFEPYSYSSVFIFRKKAAIDAGSYISEPSDFNLCIRISERYNIRNIDEPLTDIRVNEANIFEDEDSILFFNEIQKQLCKIKGSKVDDDFVLCYMNQFEPILKDENVQRIVECINCFDDVSEKILSVVNCNRRESEIHYCWYQKKRYILNQISLRLPLSKMVTLLLHYNERKMLLKNSFFLFKNRIKKILSHKR